MHFVTDTSVSFIAGVVVGCALEESDV